MENEKDYSLDRSVEVEKIIDFYKNVDNNSVDTPTTEDKRQDTFFKKLFDKAFSYIKNSTLYKKLIPQAEKSTHSEIESQAFGLGEKGRIALYHSISLVVCILIITVSVILTIFLPGNKLKISQRETELRSQEDYISLISRHTAIKTEIDELTASNNEKENLINQISDADNTKSEIRLQIEVKKSELSELNTQINNKRNEISALDKEISSKAPAEKVYTPGKYVVGTHFAAGKYLVTGTGKFMVATSSGKSKINVALSSTPLEVYLEERDVVKFGSKVKFTSVY